MRGRDVDEGLVVGVLGVEDAQGIGLGAALVVLAELVLDGGEGLAQDGDVALAVFGGADGVEFELPAFDAQLVEEGGEHFQDFGVAQWGFGAGGDGAEDFGADLPELAVTSALRPFAAELRPDVEELLQLAAVAEVVLDVGADDAGGVLGAEGEGLGLFGLGAGAILPGVHLLGDDVGLFADAAGEEGGVLEDGGANLAEAVAGEDRAGDGFDAVPEGGLGREEVAGAADGLQGIGRSGHGLPV